ncbi:Ribosomal protein L6 [Ophiocordyceps sinensis CO18]|uniref:Ribosomal protein L6 n=1 Tax=Ophiocordyceps sinensis (strain Co18 / CGMCC 3.14243) TaxID=911162 RepID=T5A9A6_OPHSC|nr:Ribosomal protein L6 [Ophiocordyceps sinensis CO18]
MAAKFAPARCEALRLALRASPAVTLPGFLVPAWQGSARRQRKHFSTTTQQHSKLGRMPISIPPGVELSIGGTKSVRSTTSYRASVKKTITIKGPLGELLLFGGREWATGIDPEANEMYMRTATLELDVPDFVGLSQDLEDRKAMLSVEDAYVKHQREMWGTTWSYLNNYVMGVSEGHMAVLRLVGVGYRASVEQRGAKEQYPGQRFLCLKLGFTHPVEEGIPKGVTVSMATPTRILLALIE